MWVYNGKEQVGKTEIQNGQLEEKRGPRKFKARAKACDEIRRLKRPGPRKGRAALKSRPHQLRVQLVERKGLRNVLLLKGNNKSKLLLT